MSNYPIIDSVPEFRLCEKLVAEHYLRHQGETNTTVCLGSDEEGVPDCFAFKSGVLHSAIELTAYVLGDIHDLRRVTQLANNYFMIDAGMSFRVHERQPHPRTLIQKKLLGERIYQRFDAKKLILLLYSDVLVRDNELSFAMLGPMNMSPSCDHFSHHREAIIEELRSTLSPDGNLQWDEVWLIDYTHNFVAENATFYCLWPNRQG